MNKIFLMGRICNDLEPKYTTNGNKLYVRFNLAVNRRGKDAGTDYISCIAWDKTADFLQNHFQKGVQVAIEGRIQTGQYDDKTGKRIYTTDVVIEQLYFTRTKEEKQNDSKPTMNDIAQAIFNTNSEELPF